MQSDSDACGCSWERVVSVQSRSVHAAPASCSCSKCPCPCKCSSSFSSTSSSSNILPNNSLTPTLPNSTSTKAAFSFKPRATPHANSVCFSSAKSILLTSNKSAASTCSASNSGTFRTATQSSPGSVQDERSPAVSHVIQSVPKVQASIRVTVLWREARRVAGCPCNLACSQLSLTATGSATPLSSTTIASNSRSPPRVNLSTLVNNSSANEQHAHPF
mmetsp:Transcript_26095/g.62674  ORF Transcript_26095/g.62674 Transcript_26095/m.62674 type:complete len:218 (-) Transcript_26095:864-1517(-)